MCVVVKFQDYSHFLMAFEGLAAEFYTRNLCWVEPPFFKFIWFLKELALYNYIMGKAEITKLVKHVEAFCKEQGVRFTEPRRYALEIIAGAQKPLGAYDILAELAKKLDNPKPPTAYRAIEFLQEYGFIHRIESLNAYVVCHTGHRHLGSQFMICDGCGNVTEAHLCDLPGDLAQKTEDAGFTLSRWNAELHGTCKTCQGSSVSSSL